MHRFDVLSNPNSHVAKSTCLGGTLTILAVILVKLLVIIGEHVIITIIH